MNEGNPSTRQSHLRANPDKRTILREYYPKAIQGSSFSHLNSTDRFCGVKVGLRVDDVMANPIKPPWIQPQHAKATTSRQPAETRKAPFRRHFTWSEIGQIHPQDFGDLSTRRQASRPRRHIRGDCRCRSGRLSIRRGRKDRSACPQHRVHSSKFTAHSNMPRSYLT